MGNCWVSDRVCRDSEMFFTSKSRFEPTKCLQSPPPISSMHTPNQKPPPLKLRTPRTEVEILSSPHLKSILLIELKNATWQFRPENLLGEGGFGFVYKGWINEQTLTAAKPGCGTVVAVKKLKPGGFQGHKEWLSEVNHLGQLHHPNLVRLIGYCLEGENRLLIYDFMPKGSLEHHLFKRNAQSLPWETRLKIAIGAARGLCFLHNSKSPVIYRDFKAANVLLDSEFNAKLSDFGLAKDGPTGDISHVTTQVMGTQGYAAPEYVSTGRLTLKCDVYSFGVVLLELLTGRRAIDKNKTGIEQKLVEWAKDSLDENPKIYRIMDTNLGGQYPRKGAYIAATLALQCVRVEAKARPKMDDLVSILEALQGKKTASPLNSPVPSLLSSPKVKSPGYDEYPSPLSVSPLTSPLPAR